MKCAARACAFICVTWMPCATWAQDRILTREEQAAVVSAVLSVEGFGGTNHWIMLRADKSGSEIDAVRLWRQIARRPNEHSEENPPELYATVRFSRFDVHVEYERRDEGIGDKESAIKQAMAFLAKRGMLPASLWITCRRVDDGFSVFYEDTEPQRVGYHGYMVITDTSLRFRPGR